MGVKDRKADDCCGKEIDDPIHPMLFLWPYELREKRYAPAQFKAKILENEENDEQENECNERNLLVVGIGYDEVCPKNEQDGDVDDLPSDLVPEQPCHGFFAWFWLYIPFDGK